MLVRLASATNCGCIAAQHGVHQRTADASAGTCTSAQRKPRLGLQHSADIQREVCEGGPGVQRHQQRSQVVQPHCGSAIAGTHVMPASGHVRDTRQVFQLVRERRPAGVTHRVRCNHCTFSRWTASLRSLLLQSLLSLLPLLSPPVDAHKAVQKAAAGSAVSACRYCASCTQRTSSVAIGFRRSPFLFATSSKASQNCAHTTQRSTAAEEQQSV
jgi:hypothetical protein